MNTLLDNTVNGLIQALSVFIQFTIASFNFQPNQLFENLYQIQAQIGIISLLVLLFAVHLTTIANSDVSVFTTKSDKTGLLIYISVIVFGGILYQIDISFSQAQMVLPQVYSASSLQQSIQSNSTSVFASLFYTLITLISVIQVFVFNIFKQLLVSFGFMLSPILLGSAVLNTTVFDPLSKTITTVTAISAWYFVVLKIGFSVVQTIELSSNSPFILYTLFITLAVGTLGSVGILKAVTVLKKRPYKVFKARRVVES